MIIIQDNQKTESSFFKLNRHFKLKKKTKATPSQFSYGLNQSLGLYETYHKFLLTGMKPSFVEHLVSVAEITP